MSLNIISGPVAFDRVAVRPTLKATLVIMKFDSKENPVIGKVNVKLMCDLGCFETTDVWRVTSQADFKSKCLNLYSNGIPEFKFKS